MKITAFMKNGDELTYEADYTDESDKFVSFMRKVNPRECSYICGALWWKETKTYTEYDYKTVVMLAIKDVGRIELKEGEK